MDQRHAMTNEVLRPIVGVGLVIVGGLFLLAQVGVALPAFSWHYLWPLFVLIPGLLLFVGMFQGGKQAAGAAVPASVVTMVGLILLYQNSTNHWHSWAYVWALIAPTSIGIGQMIAGWWGGQPAVVRAGRRLVNAGIALFVIFAVFFELVLNISGFGRSFGGIVLPVLLIAAGAGLIARERRRSEGERTWL